MKTLPTPGKTFARKKQAILSQLSVPDDAYTDASPKGSVDAGIRQLIDQVNAQAGLATTSSCAGRVSVYLEGKKARKQRVCPESRGERSGIGAAGGEAGEEEAGELGSGDDEPRSSAARSGAARDLSAQVASSAGGKGGGGQWLFVSHDPVEVPQGEERSYASRLGFADVDEGMAAQSVAVDGRSRLVHFKFEPMILHVLTASLEHAQLVIQAGVEAGFRETGAVSLLKRQPDREATPMVAVRSMGLSFESLIGVEIDGVRRLLVSPEYLETLVQIANERFAENKKRIARFSAALAAAFTPFEGKEGWEDPQARRERKRLEGLRRREQLKHEKNDELRDELGIGLCTGTSR